MCNQAHLLFKVFQNEVTSTAVEIKVLKKFSEVVGETVSAIAWRLVTASLLSPIKEA
jgi:hypothetical protein